MMQRTVIECAHQQQQQPHKRRSIKCFCLQNAAGFPSQCRLMAFTHVSIREGIYNSLTDSLKRLLTRNAIDYLEKQCTIVCLTCGSRSENPFYVQKSDGLTRVINTSQQHTFVDIVKIAALKEIDNTIKQSIKLPSMDAPTKPRSNTSTNLPDEPMDDAINASSSLRAHDRRRNTFDMGGFPSREDRRSPSPSPSLADDELGVRIDRTSRRDLAERKLTLISLYPTSESVAPTVQVNVQRSSSLTSTDSSHVFALFKLPKQQYVSASSRANGARSNSHEDLSSSHHQERERDEEKSHRFRSFFRYIFCQYLPENESPSAHFTSPLPETNATSEVRTTRFFA